MLPEKKVLQLIDMMNSMSSANIPAKKPILEMFDLAMDEKTLDYLIAMGTHSKPCANPSSRLLTMT